MLVVGMTVVSFATSSPELFISLKSTFSIIDNSTDITFGNIIGSNIANITLVLGLTAVVCRINILNQIIRIDYPFMIFVSLLFGFCRSLEFMLFVRPLKVKFSDERLSSCTFNSFEIF